MDTYFPVPVMRPQLQTQSLVWEKATKAIFDVIGLTEGMSCLDVGCGPGEVMRLMGQHVGKTGCVMGVDTEGKIGREALGILQSIDTSDFGFEGNFQNMDDYYLGKQYDLVYSTFFLIHMDDPFTVLKKMYSCVKSGGHLVIQGCDFRALDEYPENKPMKEIKRIFFGVMESSGRDIRIGSKLPYYFIKSGIGSPDGILVDCRMTPRGESRMAQDTYESVLPAAL